MERTLSQVLRCVLIPMVGIAAAGVLGVGCSKSSSDPSAVTVAELKYPGDLVITDNGNGKVALSWFASNNESKFDGFNVYGMKTTATGSGTPGARTFADLGVTEGQAIELLTTAGDPDPTGKATLGNFDYDPKGKKIEAKGTPPTPTADAKGDTPEFSARPIATYDTDGTTLLAPTCKTGTDNKCVLTTTANKGNSVSDTATSAANGIITYDVSQTDTLVAGSTYCFFVLSSEKEGSVVSQTSSNVACVTPKFDLSFTLPVPALNGASLNTTNMPKFDLAAWQADCNKNSKCADPNTTFITKDAKAAFHNNSDAGPLYLETTASGLGMVAGTNSGITDLGYYSTKGFTDPTLPTYPATFTVDSHPIPGDTNKSPVLNGGGYSLGGQTVPVEMGHVYVVAVGDPTAAAATPPTKFTYFWLYFTADPTPGAADGTVKVQMRVPTAAQ